MAAYKVFTAAAATQALKVVLEGTPVPVGGLPKGPTATSV
jgi:hypothetical protein